MKKFISAFILLVLSLMIYGCKQGSGKNSADMEQAKKEISESNSIYFQSFVKNDSSIFIDRYANDACILAPDEKMMCGQDAVARFFSTAYHDAGLRNGKFITTAVYGDAVDFVTEEGLWQSFNAAGEMFDDGKFLVLWKKTPAGWKMYRDSFSSNHSRDKN